MCSVDGTLTMEHLICSAHPGNFTVPRAPLMIIVRQLLRTATLNRSLSLYFCAMMLPTVFRRQSQGEGRPLRLQLVGACNASGFAACKDPSDNVDTQGE